MLLSQPLIEKMETTTTVAESSEIINDFTDVILQENNNTSTTTTTKTIACYSEKLNLKFIVNIQNEAVQAQQRCFIMTVHDLGHDSSQFDSFVQSEQMTGIRNRVVWLHVNLPGQELDSSDLKIKKYPSLEELGEELVCIIDYLKVPQVVCMGDGAGANICAHFAIKHTNRCLGLVLVEPVASSAGLVEFMKFKLRRLNTKSSSSSVIGNVQEKASFLMNRIGNKYSAVNDQNTTVALIKETETTENETLQLESVETKADSANGDSATASSGSLALPSSSQENNIDQLEQVSNGGSGRNAKNLTLFAQSFSSRSSLFDKVKDLNIDILTAVGKDSLSYNEAKRFYRTLQDDRKKEPKRLVNCPFLDLEHTVNVLQDSPDRLATSIQYFLQGIGLLSALPMKSNTPLYARSISMEEADRPRSSSLQSDSLTSPLVSSNPSITDSS